MQNPSDQKSFVCTFKTGFGCLEPHGQVVRPGRGSRRNRRPIHGATGPIGVGRPHPKLTRQMKFQRGRNSPGEVIFFIKTRSTATNALLGRVEIAAGPACAEEGAAGGLGSSMRD